MRLYECSHCMTLFGSERDLNDHRLSNGSEEKIICDPTHEMIAYSNRMFALLADFAEECIQSIYRESMQW